jgi:hypothetical protein
MNPQVLSSPDLSTERHLCWNLTIHICGTIHAFRAELFQPAVDFTLIKPTIAQSFVEIKYRL